MGFVVEIEYILHYLLKLVVPFFATLIWLLKFHFVLK